MSATSSMMFSGLVFLSLSLCICLAAGLCIDCHTEEASLMMTERITDL